MHPGILSSKCDATCVRCCERACAATPGRAPGTAGRQQAGPGPAVRAAPAGRVHVPAAQLLAALQPAAAAAALQVRTNRIPHKCQSTAHKCCAPRHAPKRGGVLAACSDVRHSDTRSCLLAVPEILGQTLHVVSAAERAQPRRRCGSTTARPRSQYRATTTGSTAWRPSSATSSTAAGWAAGCCRRCRPRRRSVARCQALAPAWPLCALLAHTLEA